MKRTKNKLTNDLAIFGSQRAARLSTICELLVLQCHGVGLRCIAYTKLI